MEYSQRHFFTGARMTRHTPILPDVPAVCEHELARLVAALPDGEPTLEQRLRFIDLTFECSAEARKVYPSRRCFSDEIAPTNPAFANLFCTLRYTAMANEGLPVSLLSKRERAARMPALLEAVRVRLSREAA